MTMKESFGLVMKFYLGKPLCSRTILQAVDGVFWEHLPEWREGMRLLPEYEEDRQFGLPLGKDQSLADVIFKVSPMRFGLCAVNLVGAYEGLSVFMQCSRNSLPPESNMFTIEVADVGTIEGKARSEWARGIFCAFATAIPLRYAHARTRDEFEMKNIIKEKRSVRAVGVNLKRVLPGLYWINYLGREYADLIGLDHLCATPAPIVHAIGDGVCIGLDEDPLNWQTVHYRHRECEVTRHVGQEFFFSKAEPERVTKAPLFKPDSSE